MSSDEASLINEIVEAHVATMRERYTDPLENLLKSCQSPIERVFGAALLHELYSFPELTFDYVYIEDHKSWGEIPHQYNSNVLLSQYGIGRYLVDFYVQIVGPTREVIKIAIECDGHDFHERTKEQAIKDRAKDRWLQSHGYNILRFTGSEIWKDPIDCAYRVSELIYHKSF